MKPAYSCKLFGAQQVFTGIQDCITLLHSVPGCNFGTLAIHAPNDMSKIRQTTSALNDEDIVFGGEASLSKALYAVDELYHPELTAVVTGCVSDIIHDDIGAVLNAYRGNTKILYQEAAGFRGTFHDGFEAALLRLAELMQEPESTSREKPSVNFIGIGADDPHATADVRAFRELLGPDVDLGCVLARCSVKDIQNASNASLNLVLGRGVLLAEEMKRRFGIPYEIIDYPYGLTGAEEIWRCLFKHFGIDISGLHEHFVRYTAEHLAPVYSYLKSFYGMPVSVIATGARFRGMSRFLTQELGFEVVCGRARESVLNLDDFIDEVAASDTAAVFGSSFEGEISGKLKIPVFYFDYPVFRRVCITDRPYVGAAGTVNLVEALLNEWMAFATPQSGTVPGSCGM
ncbi:MAG: nitrogenase component 1 [Lachnospiraceae bacterium]